MEKMEKILKYKAGVIICKKINNEDKFLLVNSVYNILSFPKGHLLEGEDPSKGAVRELFEETGIKIDSEILIKSKFKVYGKYKTEKYFLLNLNELKNIYIPDDLVQLNVPDKYEVQNLIWLSKDEIKNYKYNYTVRNFINNP